MGWLKKRSLPDESIECRDESYYTNFTGIIRFKMHYPKFILFSFLALSLSLSSCGGNNKLLVLKKCQILGDESIGYARANYVKLFHFFNPKKFENTYQKIKDFDYVTHRNVINTYYIAVRKIKTKDSTTAALLSSCKVLAQFSMHLADQAYPRAISHKSNHGALTDDFFLEINNIVKFDHNIGRYNKKMDSFKYLVEVYRQKLKDYQNKYKSELTSN